MEPDGQTPRHLTLQFSVCWLDGEGGADQTFPKTVVPEENMSTKN